MPRHMPPLLIQAMSLVAFYVKAKISWVGMSLFDHVFLYVS